MSLSVSGWSVNVAAMTKYYTFTVIINLFVLCCLCCSCGALSEIYLHNFGDS